MAAESTAPSRQHANSDFSFCPDAPAHIKRGWERAPQPSHLARHKGRKVWKRSETRPAKDDAEKLEPPSLYEQKNPLRDISTNTPRPVKRLRAKDGVPTGEKSEGEYANYFATLHDSATGTPKRKKPTKEAERRVGATERVVLVEKNSHAEVQEGVGEATRTDEISSEHDDVEENEAVEEDVLQAPESPAQESVRDLLRCETAPTIQIDGDGSINQLSSPQEKNIILDEQSDTSLHEPPRDTVLEAQPTSMERDGAQHERPSEATLTMPESHSKQPVGVESMAVDIFPVELSIRTPTSRVGECGVTPTSRVKLDAPQDLQSPQIGTTLLRRESLRSKASPRKKGSAQKSRTPQNSQGLKKRDTLQEREILQQFNAVASPIHVSIAENLANCEGGTFPIKLSPNQSMIATDNARSNTPCNNLENELGTETGADAQQGDVGPTTDIKDLTTAVEASQVCQLSNQDEGNDTLIGSLPTLVVNQCVDQSNDFVTESEADEAGQDTTQIGEKDDLPTRKTRSGARISDDTSVLKDFLNRAQAKKAAKIPPVLSADLPKLQGSPTRRSPRKALEPQRSDNVSPRKSSRRAKGPSTPPPPPRKAAVEEVDSSDEIETVHEPTSFRRSTRTRLPAPTKTPPGAPSFIPVRRGDGSDQVVLQKSQAQEMAIVTRANTRRNKGLSKPPALALQDLPAQSPVTMTAKERADRAKTVVWAERLASYWESKDACEEPDEQRPKVRRMRGLGPVHGTPAKKSTAVGPCSHGTPAPKRRSKMT